MGLYKEDKWEIDWVGEFVALGHPCNEPTSKYGPFGEPEDGYRWVWLLGPTWPAVCPVCSKEPPDTVKTIARLLVGG